MAKTVTVARIGADIKTTRHNGTIRTIAAQRADYGDWEIGTVYLKCSTDDKDVYIFNDIDPAVDTLTVNGVACANVADFHTNMEALKDAALGASVGGAASEPETIGAFGESITAEETPIVQLTFEYNNTKSGVIATGDLGGGGFGSIDNNNQMIRIQAGSDATGYAEWQTREVVPYKAGQGTNVRFTARFTNSAANDYGYIGIGESKNGFFFGYSNNAFGVFHRINGVDTFTAQTAWSKDVADGSGTLPNMSWNGINVFKIAFQYLGAGAIYFYVEHPETGRLINVHVIEYANANTTPSLTNPSMYIHAKTDNTVNSSTSNLTIECASAAAFIEGKVIPSGRDTSFDSTTGSIASTEAICISIHNNATFDSKINLSRVRIVRVNAAVKISGGSDPVLIRIYRTTSPPGSPSWTDVDSTTSQIRYDTAGTLPVVAFKDQIGTITIADGGAGEWIPKVENGPKFLYPDEYMYATAQTASGTATVVMGYEFKEE